MQIIIWPAYGVYSQWSQNYMVGMKNLHGYKSPQPYMFGRSHKGNEGYWNA